MIESLMTERIEVAMHDTTGLAGAFKSHYFQLESLPWQSVAEGIDQKIIFDDPPTGRRTALFRWRPGASLPLHEHTEVEQTYVLEGSLCDHEGECKAGDFVWREAGSRHRAWSPDGCLLLGVFFKPNLILEGPDAGQHTW